MFRGVIDCFCRNTIFTWIIHCIININNIGREMNVGHKNNRRTDCPNGKVTGLVNVPSLVLFHSNSPDTRPHGLGNMPRQDLDTIRIPVISDNIILRITLSIRREVTYI